MSGNEPARPARRTILGAMAVLSVTLFIVSCQSAGPPIASSASSAASAPDPPRGAPRRAPHRATGRPRRDHQRRASTPTTSSRRTARGEAVGAVPAAVTVFDRIPAVANLDPDLRGALRRAATDAAAEGVEIFVNGGWRSREYQARLLLAAVSKYGSKRRAARWVATPDTSPHVSGDAVDIWPAGATAWLSEHGAEYGLCQIYRNEPWHYELRPAAIVAGCPSMYADPTHDPRMQQ